MGAFSVCRESFDKSVECPFFEGFFRHDSQVVFPPQIAKRTNGLPLASDYLLAKERAMGIAGTKMLTKPLRVVQKPVGNPLLCPNI